VQGVRSHGGRGQVEQGDDLARRRHLAAPRGSLQPEHQALLGRPGGHQMQGLGRLRGVNRAAQRLAVQRHDLPGAADLAGQRRGEAAHEGAERRLELHRIEQAKQPAERVVAGHPVLERQDRAEQLRLRGAECRHIDAALGSAQHRRKRNEQHLRQIVPRIARTRVCN
jgi:hypothetical protein